MITSIEDLAQVAGIHLSYKDAFGLMCPLDHDTMRRLLRVMGYPCDTHEEWLESVRRAEIYRQRALPEYMVLQPDRTYRIRAQGYGTWKVFDEDGVCIHQGAAERSHVPLPALPAGYYRLVLSGGDTWAPDEHLCLLMAPQHAWLPPAIASGKKVWGTALQVYSLRSQHNWGIGDFRDVRWWCEHTAGMGADVVGLNPVHALYPANPFAYTPYSPSNRMFVTSLYIHPNDVEGFAECGGSAAWAEEYHESAFVNYAAVSARKYRCLEKLFIWFQEFGSREAFEAYRAEQGEDVRRQAVFDALQAWLSAQEGRVVSVHEWPAAYATYGTQAVRDFVHSHQQEITYYEWLYWTADVQMQRCQGSALEAGMGIGMYRDLAVGPDRSGGEVWADPQVYLAGVSVGAPGDEYNPAGQSWGLPAFDPAVLVRRGFAPFVRLVRANMKHAGALRIDHAFGLSRLYMIPEGARGNTGGYVSYPLDALLAVLRIESHRNGCMVIGEDLGTIPEGFREGASESGLMSYKVMYFEHEPDGTFLPPDRYPRLSLATVATHDLPPLAGWWQQTDIDLKKHLDIYPTQKIYETDVEARAIARRSFVDAMNRESIAVDPAAMASLWQAAYRYLGRSGSAVVMVQPEDVLGITSQMNLPGTVDEHPNWRRTLPSTIEHLLDTGSALHTVAAIMAEERTRPRKGVPSATYRLQLHVRFTFDDAAALVPYLYHMGISHIYTSPYMQARPGSMHGYDTVDHSRFSREIGGEDGYRRFIDTLAPYGMGHVLDVVPNHMGIGYTNRWWQSVLEWGMQSPFEHYFDIEWIPNGSTQAARLVLPFLDAQYGDVLDAGDLVLAFDARHGSFEIRYQDQYFPICPRDYPAGTADAWPYAHDPASGVVLKEYLAMRYDLHHELHEWVARVNADTTQLHHLLERQNYRLAYWRVGASDINYRRFFDVSEMAALRAEHTDVFDDTHGLILHEMYDDRLQGVRVDHVDGLADPAAYCRVLRRMAGEERYLVVEKILGTNETLPQDWPVDGTTGYDALNDITALMVNRDAEAMLSSIYHMHSADATDFDQHVYDAKLYILDNVLIRELTSLAHALKRIADADIHTRDYTLNLLTQVLRAVVAAFPVYRSYVTSGWTSATDHAGIESAIGVARARNRFADLSVLGFLQSVLTLEERPVRADIRDFVLRFQQITDPVMAKGYEDTALYRYNRLLALNEVGGDPQEFGISTDRFHLRMAARHEYARHGLTATATHDTKRGEDARIRIATLSYIPNKWKRWLKDWRTANARYRTDAYGMPFPSGDVEYALYQALVGSWPVHTEDVGNDAGIAEEYGERLMTYMMKFMREGRVYSRWDNPDGVYEEAMRTYVSAILNPANIAFMNDFVQAAELVARKALPASLAQVVLKMTVPGVPDIYQGTELWDLNFVDPDNRRTVDYAERSHSAGTPDNADDLLRTWQDGRVKQFVTRTILRYRRQHHVLFQEGSYEPLVISGAAFEQCIGFRREHRGEQVLVVVPITDPTLLRKRGRDWQPTVVHVADGRYRHLLTEETFEVRGGLLDAGTLLKRFPVAVLVLA